MNRFSFRFLPLKPACRLHRFKFSDYGLNFRIELPFWFSDGVRIDVNEKVDEQTILGQTLRKCHRAENWQTPKDFRVKPDDAP